MPIAWFAGRIAKALSSACGADSETSNAISAGTGALFCLVDPVGAVINTAHVGADVAAQNGSDIGKAANVGLTALSFVAAAPDLSGAASSVGQCVQSAGTNASV